MQSLSYHDDPSKPLLVDDYAQYSENDGSVSTATKSRFKWYIELASLLFFAKGSVLYLILSIYDYQYALKQMNLPPELRGVDDDVAWQKYQGRDSTDDDFMYQTTGITQYQTIYFFAAFSFVMSGIFDLIEEKALFYALMILAGAFGLAASIFVESDVQLSEILDGISVHLFLLEGVLLIMEVFRRDLSEHHKCYRLWILLADAQFLGGSFLDVLLSYSAVFHITNEWNRSTTIVGMVSNALWFNSSIVSFGVFVSDTIQAKKEKEEQERSHALIFDNDIS